MEKSPDAFRTISEVAEWLDVPTHVLRFWESRFAQVKPVKRAGGRRYYRPSDMRLIGGIKTLLHDDGMTIRAVQKLLREEGVKHVATFSQPLEHEADGAPAIEARAAAAPAVEDADAMTLPFLRKSREDRAPAPAEEEADAAWTEDAAATAEPEPEISAPEPARQTGIPSAPSDEAVVAFGSVRRQPDLEAELPFTSPRAEPTPEPTPLFDEGPAPEPPAAEPEEAPAPQPILCDAPETDPADDAAEHAGPAGPTTRLLLAERRALGVDPIHIEQVVAALRAVRDRSAS